MASIDSETGSEGFCLLQEQGSDEYSQGISEEGFLHLMEMYAQKDNVETVWLALRKFECVRRDELRRRYSNELQLLTPLPRLKLRACWCAATATWARAARRPWWRRAPLCA